MNLKEKLSERIGIKEVQEILVLVLQSDEKKQELYNLLFVPDDKVAYQAAWVFTHFPAKNIVWLYPKQNQLINELIKCKHPGKRRLLLALLYKQPFPNPPRVDFLDFCLDRMASLQELPGVQSLCMKIAYELCYPIPELVQELKTALEMMEGNLCPAISCVRRNILRAMQKRKRMISGWPAGNKQEDLTEIL